MLYECVRRFDMTSTVEIFFELNKAWSPLLKGGEKKRLRHSKQQARYDRIIFFEKRDTQRHTRDGRAAVEHLPAVRGRAAGNRGEHEHTRGARPRLLRRRRLRPAPRPGDRQRRPHRLRLLQASARGRGGRGGGAPLQEAQRLLPVRRRPAGTTVSSPAPSASPHVT